ncbi:hypothetical protein ACSNN7_24365 [Micromonospora sp. URMC 105]|uniref:hypothetical protein n=1 Tax=Micromonospora sp. URMC 105 TaxID=3423413 RepID=UPI003F1BEDB8
MSNPPSHEHRARVDLPEWMRNPEPPRRTPSRLLSELADRTPVLRELRRAMWRWRAHARFSERHPVLSAVVSFVFVAAAATVLVAGAAYLLGRMREGTL